MTKKMSNELFNVDPTKLNKEEPLLLDGLYKYNKDNDIDRIIYLGDIEYNNFLDCSIPCYAVNVKGLVKKKDDIFKVNDHSYITKMNYLDVIKNGSLDSSVFSSLFLLLTYFT
jgi:hypothetical protein